MDRDFHSKKINLVEQGKIKYQIKSQEKILKKLEEDYTELHIKKFIEHYNENPHEVMKEYSERLYDCCYQGGEGYEYWLDKPWGKPLYSHCVVKPLNYSSIAQPTQMELDAYYVITGKDMVITKEIHTEYWGIGC